MPAPLPRPGEVDLNPPGAEEVAAISRGIMTAVAPTSGPTETQRLLLRSVTEAMTGYPASHDDTPLGPEELSAVMGSRDLVFRTRIVQLMILLGLVLRPLPEEVAARIARYSAALSVEESMIDVARRFAQGSLGLAAFDFERNGYLAGWKPTGAENLHASHQLATPWDLDVDDDDLVRRWRALEKLPDASLGRLVTEFYRARGFVYPGLPGSAPPLLAQHDWVHVLADYGTTVESELEVFAFIARANDDMHAFSLLAMVVSLFETGYLRTGAGLFESSPGHLSVGGMDRRVADAMRRGALCAGSVDFLRVDWFELAELDLIQARAHFGVPVKAQVALDAGSVGPWQPGGISPFQVRAGSAMAEAAGQRYQSFGATPDTP